MDGAMGSPIAQMALPAAAGYAGSRGGAAGVNAALNTSQFMMRQAADKRVRDMFGEIGPYDDPSQDVTAAGAGSTPRAASRVGDYIDMLNRSVAEGGMAAFAPAMRQMTSMQKTLSGYEEPVTVPAGHSQMQDGVTLGTAPKTVVDEGNVIKDGAIAGIAPARQAQLDETMRMGTGRLSELGTREELTGARIDTEASRQNLNAARIQKIESEITHEIGKGNLTKEGVSLQLKRVNEAINDMEPKSNPEQMKNLIKLRGILIERWTAIYQAEEATKGDSTEEGTGMTGLPPGGSIDTMAGGGLSVSPTGQVGTFIPGRGVVWE